MKILDTEIEFDFLDADNVEKIEGQIGIVESKIKQIDTDKLSISIRESCAIIRECFDNIFGKGTAKKIFGNKYSLTLCVKAFHELVEEKINQEAEFEKQMNSFNDYLPKRIERE